MTAFNLVSEEDAFIAMLQPTSNFKKRCVKLLKRAVGKARTLLILCLDDPRRLGSQLERYYINQMLNELDAQGAVIHGNEVMLIKLYAETREDYEWALANEKSVAQFCAVVAGNIEGKPITCDTVLFEKSKFSGRAYTWHTAP